MPRSSAEGETKGQPLVFWTNWWCKGEKKNVLLYVSTIFTLQNYILSWMTFGMS